MKSWHVVVALVRLGGGGGISADDDDGTTDGGCRVLGLLLLSPLPSLSAFNDNAATLLNTSRP